MLLFKDYVFQYNNCLKILFVQWEIDVKKCIKLFLMKYLVENI